MRQQWDEANEKFPGNTIVRMIDPVKLLTRPEVVADVQSFFAEHPIPQAAKTLDQILERQRVNAALHAREHDRFSDRVAADESHSRSIASPARSAPNCTGSTSPAQLTDGEVDALRAAVVHAQGRVPARPAVRHRHLERLTDATRRPRAHPVPRVHRRIIQAW